jgi:hypothetical protein
MCTNQTVRVLSDGGGWCSGSLHAGPHGASDAGGCSTREACGITRVDVGEAIRAGFQDQRLELERTGFKRRDVTDLLTLYARARRCVRACSLSPCRQRRRLVARGLEETRLGAQLPSPSGRCGSAAECQPGWGRRPGYCWHGGPGWRDQGRSSDLVTAPRRIKPAGHCGPRRRARRR